MAFLRNQAVQVNNSFTNVKAFIGTVNIHNFLPANAVAFVTITNPDTGTITYTLAGLFSDFFIRPLGSLSPTISLIVKILPPDSIDDEDAIDVSDSVIGDISINWPEDSAGSAVIKFASSEEIGSFTNNPFNVETGITRTTLFATGSKIFVQSRIDFETPTSAVFVHTIFTGRISSFSYDSQDDTISVSCVDMSYDISKPSDRISKEFVVTQNKIFTEDITVEPVLIFPEDSTVDAEGLGNHQFVDISLRFTRIGGLDIRIIQNGVEVPSDEDFWATILRSFSIVSITQVEDSPNGKYIIRININKVPEGLFKHFLRRVSPPSTLKISYEISTEDAVLLLEDTTRKSNVLSDIIAEAKIDSAINLRAGQIEDESVKGNIVANREFPLDFIRKIIIPQTWFARFDPRGSLVIGRDFLNNNPNFVFSDKNIIKSTLTLSKNESDAIDSQEVLGALISTPADTRPTTPIRFAQRPSCSPLVTIKAAGVPISAVGEEVVLRGGKPLEDLTPGFFTVHVIVPIDLFSLGFGGGLNGSLCVGTNINGVACAVVPKLVMKTDTRFPNGFTSFVDRNVVNNVGTIVQPSKFSSLQPTKTTNINMFPGWLAYYLSNNDSNFASFGTNWGYLPQDMFARTLEGQIDETKWFNTVLPSFFTSSPSFGLFKSLTTPAPLFTTDIRDPFFISMTITRAFTVDPNEGTVTIHGFTADLEIYLRICGSARPRGMTSGRAPSEGFRL
jgi:hypothetical protein